jgi:hypothetical protein
MCSSSVFFVCFSGFCSHHVLLTIVNLNAPLINLHNFFFSPRTGSLPSSSEQLLGHKEGPRDSVTLLDAKELLKHFTSEGLPVGDLQPLQVQKG